MSEAKAIGDRIREIGPGRAFVAMDFSDITDNRNASNVLGRLVKRGGLRKAIRGVYYLPEYSAILDAEVPISANEVACAVARANKWIIAPAGAAALNALGLDTQVPAKIEYVSSGPYKSYEYESRQIEFRHRANRDLLSCSPITCAIVQALKALGKDNVSEETAQILAKNLSVEQIETFRNESVGLTSWVAAFSRELAEVKNGRNCQGVC